MLCSVTVKEYTYEFYLCDTIYHDVMPLINKYSTKAIGASVGRNRIVFMTSKGFVIKLPLNQGGCGDNEWESSVSSCPDSTGRQLARTRFHCINGIIVLFMETVNHLADEEIIRLFGEIPWWVDGIDCGQVGINRKGKLVAYDYGIN